MSEAQSTNRSSSSRNDNDDLREQLSSLKSDLSNLSDTVRKQAKTEISKVEEHAAEKMEDLETQIRKNPIASTAIAAGVGFLIGAILSR